MASLSFFDKLRKRYSDKFDNHKEKSKEAKRGLVNINVPDDFVAQVMVRYIIYVFVNYAIFYFFIMKAVERWPEVALEKSVVMFFVSSAVLFNVEVVCLSFLGWIRSFDAKLIEYMTILISVYALYGISGVEYSILKDSEAQVIEYINKTSKEFTSGSKEYVVSNCNLKWGQGDGFAQRRVARQERYCEFIDEYSSADISALSYSDISEIIKKEFDLSRDVYVRFHEFERQLTDIRKGKIGIEKARSEKANTGRHSQQLVAFWLLALALALRTAKTTIEIFKLDDFSKKQRSERS
ncbi:hypothetical protein [Azospirillum sp. Sh1]|uniref:hypothetical protein n=1 Tax=Azospirillum sp. Sh1 TaxID=2607285 RepID=UPI00125C6DA1|nr:hypothetical protein [Azospirillum sp. Sh1]KAA0581780.1 hypothetical protein FZ029_04245 [Azospirillum sp. Sh1]